MKISTFYEIDLIVNFQMRTPNHFLNLSKLSNFCLNAFDKSPFSIS